MPEIYKERVCTVSLCLGNFIWKIDMPISLWKKRRNKAILCFGLRCTISQRQLYNDQDVGRGMFDFLY